MPPSEFKYVVLDVFTTEPFTGNQLAIVHLRDEHALTRERRHQIVREFNFSETVFLYDLQPGAAGRKMEIWTPEAELPFAGHPTIGTAWYCGNLDAQQQQQQQEQEQEFTLQLLAGPVTASCDTVTATAAALIPHNVHIHKHPVTAEAVWRSQPSLEAFVLRNQDAKATKEAEEKPQQQYPLRADFPVVSIVKGMTFILVELPTVQDHLGRVQAGAGAIEGVQLDENWESVITSPYFYVILPSSDSKITKIRTRMVEARIGEDAATGSAASSLCTYLSLQRGEAGASYAFEIEQGVEMGRRSVIRVTVVLDNTGHAIERVRLGGSAVVTMQGVLTA